MKEPTHHNLCRRSWFGGRPAAEAVHPSNYRPPSSSSPSKEDDRRDTEKMKMLQRSPWSMRKYVVRSVFSEMLAGCPHPKLCWYKCLLGLLERGWIRTRLIFLCPDPKLLVGTSQFLNELKIKTDWCKRRGGLLKCPATQASSWVDSLLRSVAVQLTENNGPRRDLHSRCIRHDSRRRLQKRT